MSLHIEQKREIWYRSGAAARLAGLPVETLRVWERRYGLSDTQRSAHGQRLYSEDQVKRLGLLKQLVDQGHPIGQLAALPLEQLRDLAGAGAQAEADEPVRMAVVGVSLARRIAVSREGHRLEVAASWTRLADVAELGEGQDADLLVVELSELHESSMPAIAAARDATRAAAVMVLYRFSSSATIRILRANGWLVARVPAEIGELASLCRAALSGQGLQPARIDALAATPVRFDEQALADITSAANRLVCECPRHLAEVLMTVGSFERYSAQCASRNEEDRLMHRELFEAAARARGVLEEAMERLARAEGLPLPQG